ncbi:conserved Plasmodium protein, unknown function [Plasmodium malariae]|uniref:Uncharacterized protein n=1 Tax=Plasmodium malariae TaxID=5858 RepID=A0A1C3L1F9_PLAMA|nr:conserved Plasmodium protein, unknown function [Plasmodium malariae]SBT80298.1 conserved Plasmodium protein, unknown function [Plasmodium malariae]SCO93936.1 conserved Plasmodium protein, unknown function [Plasmodium malariae]
MIVKKNKKNLTHFAWLALLIIPSFYFKNLLFDNFSSLKFDKFKKKIYNKTLKRISLPNKNFEEMNNYILHDNFH